jgi:hypothetical protein
LPASDFEKTAARSLMARRFLNNSVHVLMLSLR